MSKQDFTDLVLLIGTNPLPNYVVAKFFHLTNKNLQRIWLIHSEETKFSQGTGRYAENIENVLRNEFKKSNIQYLKEALPDVSQASEIASEVKKLFSGKEAQIRSLHLNYTGGTKAMSVHVYQALNNMFKDRFSASYLDARDYHLKFDENPDLVTGDLRNLIQLENSDLFKLHSNSNDLNPKKTYLDIIQDKSKSEAIMHYLAELANKGKVLDLRNWFNTAEQKGLFKEGKKDGNRIEGALGGYSLSNNPELFAYLGAFPDNDRFVDKEGNWIYNNFDSNVNSKKLKNFNQGGWLESYVVWVLKKHIKNSDKNIISNIEFKTNEGAKFEIDVLVKNGYQICGISCGTTLKYEDGQEKLSNSIKNKGFEIILRSFQIGGEEARSALVTLVEPRIAANLENDLIASTGAGRNKFIVLGRNDLPEEKLWKKLEKHIYQ
ncbi:MAG: hypothetical protein ACOX69_08395 [Coriobacteriales bacterium]|jgi:hypothetical protein